MINPITVLPIGPVKDKVIQNIGCSIENTFKLPCIIGEQVPVPDIAYDSSRCQYNSRVILELLTSMFPESNYSKILGITHVDIFIPVMKYVFGLSVVGGRCAVISLFRFNEVSSKEDILIERAIKTAIHELAHTFGMIHCRVKKCVMYPSTVIKDTDNKDSRFCMNCKNLLYWNIHNRSHPEKNYP